MFRINTTTHCLLLAILGVLIIGLMRDPYYAGSILLIVGAPSALVRMIVNQIGELKRKRA